MALQILENNGTFYLEGNINAATSRFLIIHFEHMINKLGDVTVNIENISEIDANGVAALKTLYAGALRSDNSFSIIGYGCKELYDDFRNNQVA